MPPRLLLVEDHDDHRFILRTQLRRRGSFDFLEATDGQQALAIVTREPLDLICLNLGLPVLDGWAVSRRIRALASPLRDIPIIAITAYALPGEEQRARAAGCDEYMAKPIVDYALLHQKILRLLTHGRTP